MAYTGYWCFIETELKDLEEIFKIVFQCDEVIWDYENVWEWIMPKNENGSQWFNISRQHNWKTGEYDKPLMIKTECQNEKHKHEIGNLLSSLLKCDIFEGNAEFDDKTHEFMVYPETVYRYSQ